MKLLKWGKTPKGFLRLNFGENPNIFSPAFKAAQEECGNMNFYPDSEKIELRTLLSEQENVKIENIFIGNGIDGLIELTTKVFINSGNEVLLPSPTFPAYIAATELMGGTIISCLLEEDFNLNFKEFISKISSKTKLIFLANPNNPTGNILMTPKQIEKILQNYAGILAVDEAYFEFSNVTVLPLIKKYKNLIVFRGFSKAYGIAGLRIGAAFADAEVLQFFQKAEGSSQVFSVNRIALSAAKSVLENKKESEEFIQLFLEQKKEFEQRLMDIPDVQVFPTKTCVSLFSTPLSSKIFNEKMANQCIAMKSMSLFENCPENLIMSAIPPKEEFNRVIKAIKKSLS